MKLRLGKLVMWRRVVPLLAAGVVAIVLLTYHLTTLVAQLGPTEAVTEQSTARLATFITNPDHLVIHVLEWAGQQLPLGSVLDARLPSVILGLVTLGLFTYLAQRWYGRRSMVFGFLLFATAAWFLHVARFGGVDIEYMVAMLALLTVHVRLSDHEDSTAYWYAWLVTNLLLLTVPGMVWFVLVNTLWQWRTLWHVFQRSALSHRLITAGLCVASFGGLAVGLIRNHLLWQWLGLPQPSVAALRMLPQQLGHVALAVGFQGPHRPEVWLAQLPILDFFVFAMFLVGIVFYARHWRAARTQLLAIYLVLAVLLASVDEPHLGLFVPLLYLIALGGIAYILHFWLQHFPANPLARALALVLVTALVFVSCSYNLAQYFVAWPNNPEVVSLYQPK